MCKSCMYLNCVYAYACNLLASELEAFSVSGARTDPIRLNLRLASENVDIVSLTVGAAIRLQISSRIRVHASASGSIGELIRAVVSGSRCCHRNGVTVGVGGRWLSCRRCRSNGVSESISRHRRSRHRDRLTVGVGGSDGGGRGGCGRLGGLRRQSLRAAQRTAYALAGVDANSVDGLPLS